MTPVEFAKQVALCATASAVCKQSNVGRVAGNMVKNVIRPTIKPKPHLVAKAENMSEPKHWAAKARDFVANVPAGERYSQRPIANTLRLGRMDGLWGSRRIQQGGMLLGGYQGVSAANAAANNIQAQKEHLYNGLTANANIPEERREVIKKDLDDLTSNLGWRLPMATARRAFGWGDEQTKARDRLLTNTAWEGAKGYVHHGDKLPTGESTITDYLRTKFTPAQYATSTATDRGLKAIIPKPDPVRYGEQALQDVQTAFPDVSVAQGKDFAQQKLEDYYGIQIPKKQQSQQTTAPSVPKPVQQTAPAEAPTPAPPKPTQDNSGAIRVILALLAAATAGAGSRTLRAVGNVAKLFKPFW